MGLSGWVILPIKCYRITWCTDSSLLPAVLLTVVLFTAVITELLTEVGSSSGMCTNWGDNKFLVWQIVRSLLVLVIDYVVVKICSYQSASSLKFLKLARGPPHLIIVTCTLR